MRLPPFAVMVTTEAAGETASVAVSAGAEMARIVDGVKTIMVAESDTGAG